jgi:CRP-like cAMP-binding protein
MTKARTRKTDELHHLAPFRDCTPAELRALAGALDEASLPAGRTLCRQGETGLEAFVIASGEVDVIIDDIHVATLGAGQMVGELSVLDRGPRTATVITRTPVELFVIPGDRFKVLVERAPTMAESLMVALSRRLRAVDEAVASGGGLAALSPTG